MFSDDMLSQDEINALLNGLNDDDDELEAETPPISEYLSPVEQDALGEIGNISFGSSATALSTLLNQKVDITTPTVTLIEREFLKEEFPHPYVAIQVNYTTGFDGLNLLVIKQSDAAIIADLMLGGEGLNPSALLDEIQLSAVQEAMNQMMGSAATSMSTIFNKKVDISPPSIDLLNILEGQGESALPPDNLLVKVSFRLRIGSLIDSNIMQLLPVKFAKDLVGELMQTTTSAEEVPVNTQTSTPYEETALGVNQEPIEQPVQPVYQEQMYMQQAPNRSMETQQGVYIQQEMQQSGPQHYGSQYAQGSQPVTVQPATFSSFQPQQLQPSEAKNLDMLLDIPLQVTVELGRTKKTVKDILELSSGSIIELDKLAGEPVDILVNNRLIATGEVVVIDENFGVRVTDIISQTDRLKKLR